MVLSYGSWYCLPLCHLCTTFLPRSVMLRSCLTDAALTLLTIAEVMDLSQWRFILLLIDFWGDCLATMDPSDLQLTSYIDWLLKAFSNRIRVHWVRQFEDWRLLDCYIGFKESCYCYPIQLELWMDKEGRASVAQYLGILVPYSY